MSRAPALRRGAPARFATPVMAPAPIIPPEYPPDPAFTQTPAATVLRPTFTPDAYVIDQVNVEDLDQLWDWVRSDREGTTGFLGVAHPHSQSFFSQMGECMSGWFRAVRHADALAGFAKLILAPQAGTLLFYVEPTSRGALGQIVPAMVRAVDAEFPHLALMVVSSQDDAITAFESTGFEKKTVLTRPALSTGVVGDRI